MQIGDKNLDAACAEAIAPALKACGLDPKRVDKHNEGRLLKSEIVGFIEGSTIIVADLTNERPNCYLEIGYAMGAQKFMNLILTAREDHNHDSPNYKRGGPKIHFDLAGYDILFWHPERIGDFRAELEKRIKHRLALLSLGPTSMSAWDQAWITKQRHVALNAVAVLGDVPFMEARFALDGPKIGKSQQELNDAARSAQVDGVFAPYYDNSLDFRPRPTADGIHAEISKRDSYDYWTLRTNGDFYYLGLLSDMRVNPTKILADTRIRRVAEALFYCARLYSHLGVEPSAIINIAVKHGGLRGRSIGSSGPTSLLRDRRASVENEAEKEISASVQAIESDVVALIKELLDPLFVLFDFVQLTYSHYRNVVEKSRLSVHDSRWPVG